MSKFRKNEIVFLLKIIKDESAPDITSLNFNAEKLIQLAGIHRVSYQLLVYAQGNPDHFSPEQIEKLALRCRRNAMRSLDQLHELIRVSGILQAGGIPFVVIKGPQLAHMLYGREALKESVDLDILLYRESDLEPADSLLKHSGFSRSNLNAHAGKLSRKIFLIAKREVQYTNPGNRIHIDLHIRPGANTYLTAGLFRDFLNDPESYDLDSQPVNILPPEKYLVYLCYHGALHQFARLAWLMDIRAFVQAKGHSLNYSDVHSLAVRINSERSLFAAMLLLQDLFEDEIPVVLEQAMMHKKRINHLVNRCKSMLVKDQSYGLSLRGRASRLVYMMILLKGFPAKLDFLYGIFMRSLSSFISRTGA